MELIISENKLWIPLELLIYFNSTINSNKTGDLFRFNYEF